MRVTDETPLSHIASLLLVVVKKFGSKIIGTSSYPTPLGHLLTENDSHNVRAEYESGTQGSGNALLSEVELILDQCNGFHKRAALAVISRLRKKMKKRR